MQWLDNNQRLGGNSNTACWSAHVSYSLNYEIKTHHQTESLANREFLKFTTRYNDFTFKFRVVKVA